MKKDNKNIIIGILLIIILTLLIVVGYLFFNKEKGEEKEPVKEEVVEINKIILDETNKEVLKGVNLKLVDSTLYINDKQTNIMFEGTIYSTGKYILITPAGQLGYAINYAIDGNGNIINVKKDITLPVDAENLSYQVEDIKVENNKVVANLPLYIFCTSEDKCDTKVEFIFDNGVTLKEIK